MLVKEQIGSVVLQIVSDDVYRMRQTRHATCVDSVAGAEAEKMTGSKRPQSHSASCVWLFLRLWGLLGFCACEARGVDM